MLCRKLSVPASSTHPGGRLRSRAAHRSFSDLACNGGNTPNSSVCSAPGGSGGSARKSPLYYNQVSVPNGLDDHDAMTMQGIQRRSKSINNFERWNIM